MAPQRPFDPTLLDAIEETVIQWRGVVYRQVFEGTDVLRANIRGARWNPPEVEALYCSLQSRTAAAEVDHFIGRQPVPIRNFETLERCEITSEMVMGEDLSKPQLVGGAAAWLQCAGMLIPSARDEGVNLVVFVNNMAPTDRIDLVSQEVYQPTS